MLLTRWNVWHNLDTVFRKRHQIYNYTYSAYSESSHLFFGEKVIQSQKGCQKGDPEGPALIFDTIPDIVNQMVSQFNVWYLDDGNLSDDYRTVLEDLKPIIASMGYHSRKLNVTRLSSEIVPKAVVNLLKRTDIMVFPVPEARYVSRGTTTPILSWNRRWVPSKFPQFLNHMVWPEQTQNAQMELP